ncbi:MAG: right-handed parallel beta-helix repeat-containing protein, partial [bacterium]
MIKRIVSGYGKLRKRIRTLITDRHSCIFPSLLLRAAGVAISRIVFPILVFLLFIFISRAHAIFNYSSTTFNGSGNNSDGGYGVTVDNGGNVYIIGHVYESATNNIWVAKYNSNLILQSSTTFNGYGNNDDFGYGVAVDTSGNVYVTGNVSGGVETDIWVAKYNSNLILQSSITVGGSNSSGYGVAVDTSGNVYVTGSVYYGANKNIWVAKYNSGLILQSSTTINGSGNGNDSGNGIAVDTNGNVYVTGSVYESDFNTWLAKYNSNLILQSSKTIEGSYNDYGYGITVDNNGDVYVTGVFGEPNNPIIWVYKYNSNLIYQTGTTFDGRNAANSTDYGRGVTTDESGNVYVTGNIDNGTNSDIWLAKYNSNLVLQSSMSINGSGNGSDSGYGVAVDTSGNVYVTGSVGEATYNIWLSKHDIGVGGDTTPPADVTSFTATPGDTQATLVWTDPADADLDKILIVRNTNNSFTAPSDGTAYTDGAASGPGGDWCENVAKAAETLLVTSLSNGTKYYFKAYSFDTSTNYATGVSTNVTPAAVAASSTYTFTTGAGTDKWAYDAVDTSNPPTSGPALTGQIEITDYTNIDSANDVYHSSAIYSTNMSFLNCKFTIGEATSSISQIYVEWDGYNTAFNSTSTQIRIWDFNSSAWIFLDGYDGEAEVVLSSAIASNFGNYISGGYLYAYAVGRGAGIGDPPSVLYSDFIKVVVTYTGDATPPSAISNLTALTGDSGGTVKLKWTAPGDDGTGGGNIQGYIVKYATNVIGSGGWDFYDARVSTYMDADGWTPGTFGQEETGRVVSGLNGGTTYYFAIKAYDDASNLGTWPDISVYQSGFASINCARAQDGGGAPGSFTGNFSSAGGADYDGNSTDFAYGVAVDTISGGGPYIYMVGASSNGASGFDWVIIKYDSNGNKIASAVYDGDAHGHDRAYAVAVTPAGEVFVAGYESNATDTDIRVIKFDSSLVLVSSAVYDSTYADAAYGIAISPYGEIVVVGATNNGANNDYIIRRYNFSLGFLGSETLNGAANGDDVANAVAIDSNGNVIVTGESSNGADSDYFTVKYNAILDTLISSVTHAGPSSMDDSAQGVAVNSTDDIIVTGWIWDGADRDIFTIKYDNALSVLSSATYGNAINNDAARAVAVDGQNNVIVAGYQLNGSYNDYVTLKYSADLSTIFSSATYDSSYDDSVKGVAVGVSSAVYVTGYVSNSGTTGDTDFATMRYYLAGDSDPGPPAAVSDLAAYTGLSEGEVDLTWSAPGDDGWTDPLPAGSQFRIQYATYSTPVWMYQSAQVIKSTSGVSPTTQVSYTVTGLNAGATYYFKIWHADEVPNWSELSNGATAHAQVPQGGIWKSIQGGDWAAGAIWDKGSPPNPASVVEISHTVTFNMFNAECSSVTVYDFGTLQFDGAVSTRSLTIAGNLKIMGGVTGGKFLMPPNTGYISTLKIKCASAGQYGIIVQNGGVFDVRGNSMNFWRTTLSVQANSAQNQLTTTDSTGWKLGDVVTIGASSLSNTTEERTITLISGNVITLNSTLSVNHSAGAEVVNLLRNCVITSATSTYKAYIRNLSQTEANFNMKYVEASYLGVNSSGKYGITFDGSGTMGKINYCSIYNGGYDGIFFNSTSSNTITNNSCYSFYDGILLNNGVNNTLNNNSCYSNSQFGIHLLNTSSNTLSNNGCYSNSSYGIRVDNSSNNIFDNNSCYSNTSGIYFANTSNANVVDGNSCYLNSATGIYFYGSSSGTVINNSCYSNSEYGILVYYNSDSNTISNNSCYLNTFHGIFLFDSFNNTLSNNRCYSNSSGFRLNNGSNNIFINNSCYSNSQYGIFTRNSADNLVVDCKLGKEGNNTSGDIGYEAGFVSKLILKNCNLYSPTKVETSGIDTAGSYLISYNQDGSTGTTKIWGDYNIPSGSTGTFNYAGLLYVSAATQPNSTLKGTGSISSPQTSDGKTLTEFWEVKCTDASATSIFSVKRGTGNVLLLDTPSNAQELSEYTSSDRGVSFTVQTGDYQIGDAFYFVTVSSSNDAGVQKIIEFSSSTVGTRLNVEVGGTITMEGTPAEPTISTSSASGGYYGFASSGTMNASNYKFFNLNSEGLKLQGTAVDVVDLSSGT